MTLNRENYHINTFHCYFCKEIYSIYIWQLPVILCVVNILYIFAICRARALHVCWLRLLLLPLSVSSHFRDLYVSAIFVLFVTVRIHLIFPSVVYYELHLLLKYSHCNYHIIFLSWKLTFLLLPLKIRSSISICILIINWLNEFFLDRKTQR